MWLFEGYHSGEAKEYLVAQLKKAFKKFSIIFSIFYTIIFLIMAIVLVIIDIDFIWFDLLGWLLSLLLGNGILYIVYACQMRKPKSKIEIRNDGFYIDTVNGQVSLVFYKIQDVCYFDDFIVLNKQYVLEKALLVKGDWNEVVELLQKVEASLDTDEPMYQIEEPETIFYQATVIEKRIFEKFITGVSAVTPVGLFEYFILFDLGENGEAEYQVSQEWYEQISEKQTGTLVIVNGRFFSFGDGEEME